MPGRRFDRSEWEPAGPDRRTRWNVVRNKRTGAVVTRRQFENIKARDAGWSSWSEYQRVARGKVPGRSKAYRRWVKQASELQGIPERQLRAMDSEFNMLFLKAQRAGFPKSADGPFAEFLSTGVGSRVQGAHYDVGDTPGGATKT